MSADMRCWRLDVRWSESYLQLICPPFSHLNLVNRPYVNRAATGEGMELLKRIVFVTMAEVSNL
jgi:hypothetical protein